MTALYAAAFAVCFSSLVLYASGRRVSPDGKRYLAMAAGDRAPTPFFYRWLLPRLFGSELWAWAWSSFVAHAAASAGIALLAQSRGLSDLKSFMAAALFSTLPLCRTAIRLPVLVDMTAIAFVVYAALAASTGHVVVAVLVVCVGATVKEIAPVFAAALAWCPWLLIGLAMPLALRLIAKPAPHASPETATPFAYARIRQADRVFDPFQRLLPWGACLAGLAWAGPWVVVSLALGYATLFVATDNARLYQWGGIPLSIAAASVVPEPIAALVLAAHVLNPWQGDV